ncbi:MAG: hypothetical protein JWM98_1039 [Thermoleophilia bacterium]|nr:hypothetical protein [Thermoleophilia bacterium]
MTGGRRVILRGVVLATIAAWAFAVAFTIGSVDAHAASTPDAPAANSGAPLPGPRLEQRRDTPRTTVEEVSRTVMCPSCDTTLDQSTAPAAERMRTYVSTAVAAGWTADEIRDGLVREYDGDESILAEPRADGLGLVAWIFPGIVAIIAVLGGFVLVRRWRAGAPQLAADQARSASSSSYSQASPSPSEPSHAPSPDAPPSGRASSSAR